MDTVTTKQERFRLLSAIEEPESGPDIGFMMDAKAFIRALKICAAVIRERSFEAPLPVIQLILPFFEPRKLVRFKGTVSVSVVTPVVSVCIPVECDYTENRGGIIQFPAKIVPLISAWKASKIHLRRTDNGAISIIGGNKMCTFMPDKDAVMQKDIAPVKYRIFQFRESAAAQLAALSAFAAQNDSRRALRTVHAVFNSDATGYMLEATNGKSLLRRATPGIKCAEGISSDDSFLINSMVCKLLPRLFGDSPFELHVGAVETFGGAPRQERLQFVSNEGSIGVWAGDTSQYPHIQQVIPGPMSGVALIPSFSLLWAASELLRYKKDLGPVRMEVTAKAELIITAWLSHGADTFRATVPCDSSLKGNSCSWYLPGEEFLRLLTLTGDIRVEFADPYSPLSFITATKLCVIMPSRVK